MSEERLTITPWKPYRILAGALLRGRPLRRYVQARDSGHRWRQGNENSAW